MTLVSLVSEAGNASGGGQLRAIVRRVNAREFFFRLLDPGREIPPCSPSVW